MVEYAVPGTVLTILISSYLSQILLADYDDDHHRLSRSFLPKMITTIPVLKIMMTVSMTM
jgi:hypothetical protein